MGTRMTRIEVIALENDEDWTFASISDGEKTWIAVF